MIEEKRRSVKSRRGVTAGAAPVELPQVDVFMAGPAGRFEGSISNRFHDPSREIAFFRRMTLSAGDGLVLVCQGIAGLLVHEQSRLETLDGVATRTVVGELADMRILDVAVATLAERHVSESAGSVAL